MAWFYREKQTDDLLRFTGELERLAYGLLILRANLTSRVNRYAEVLRAIERDNDLFDESSPLQLSKDERKWIVNRLNGDIYRQPRIPSPLLLRLDSLLADEGATYNHRVISIEHVLPQNPKNGSQWTEWFPDVEERAQWTHRLANLILLSRRKNYRASNYEFEKKKKEYFQKHGVTNFALTTQVINETEWTPAILEWRLG